MKILNSAGILRGSLLETLNHLIDVLDEEYITDDELKNFREQVLHCLKVLNGYIAYLERQSNQN